MSDTKPKVAAELLRPYHVVVFDNVFPDHVYETMRREWPSEHIHVFDGYPGGVKRHFNQQDQAFSSVIKNGSYWKTFFAPGFGVGVLDHFGIDKGKIKNLKMEFSSLPEGGGLLPHPDTPKKIVTGVFYYPDPSWEPAWGGGFEVVRHKTDPEGDFTGMHLPWEEVETIMTVNYRPNRAVFMARTNNSLHGVRPLKCPAGVTRNSVTFNWINR